MNRIPKAALAAVALLCLTACGGGSSAPGPVTLTEASLSAPVEALQVSGDPANRINLVLLGDGYREADQAKLTQDARAWLAAFRQTAPFANYANYFNIKLVHLVSAEDGAANGMYGLGTLRSTVLGATFQNANPSGQAPDYRLLVVDNARALAVALARAPECTRVMVLVNDTKYGGSGGTIPVFSANPASCAIALHEFGHAFGGLADEYACGDTSPLPASLETFPNVTAQPGSIKWAAWINPGTPLPTPAFCPDLGLFEGAYYHDTGVFRPRPSCRMRCLTDTFCEVCSEAIVRSIYNQVRPVDTLTADGGALTLTRPVPLPDTFQIAWTVDGAGAGTGDRITLPAGTHQVSARVVDATPLVRTGTDRLAVVRTWTSDGASIQADVRQARHRVVQVIRTPAGFQVAGETIVDLPLPPGPDTPAWTVSAVDSEGRMLFRTGIEDPTLLRGEFQHAEASDRIQGRRLDGSRPVSFLVRMPILEADHLEVATNPGPRHPTPD